MVQNFAWFNSHAQWADTEQKREHKTKLWY